MQNFTITPTQSKVINAQVVHEDRTPDSFNPPFSWSIDKPDLASFETFWGPGVTPNQVRINPLPAAAAGGVITLSGSFVNENGETVTEPCTVSIVANLNPGKGIQYS